MTEEARQYAFNLWPHIGEPQWRHQMIVGVRGQRLDVKSDGDIQVAKHTMLLLVKGSTVHIDYEWNFWKVLPYYFGSFHHLLIDKAITK